MTDTNTHIPQTPSKTTELCHLPRGPLPTLSGQHSKLLKGTQHSDFSQHSLGWPFWNFIHTVLIYVWLPSISMPMRFSHVAWAAPGHSGPSVHLLPSPGAQWSLLDVEQRHCHPRWMALPLSSSCASWEGSLALSALGSRDLFTSAPQMG